MKTLAFVLLLAGCGLARAQTVRYFEFRVTCGYNDWRDTSFIAAASDPALIADVLHELSLPQDARKLIGGPITHGHGGHNHNASHWFRWHFVPDQWQLNDVAVEVCDGCPYTDVDNDTAYWIGNLGQFCPWSSRPAREVILPGSVTEPGSLDAIHVFPNPANDQVFLNLYGQTLTRATVYDTFGKPVLLIPPAGIPAFDVSTLASGLYVLRLENGLQRTVKKLWVVH